jgi:transcriptional regulator GlxA family with amidase domain
VELHPALTVELEETIESFDAAHPAGADFVIVPAVGEPSDARLVSWLRDQAQRGATLVAICDGVWPVAETGVLAGRRATGHWYSLDDLEEKFPNTVWVRDRRYVRDGPVMTTTAVTASVPASLALIDQIAGRSRAAAVAKRLGVNDWSAAHDSGRFTLSARDVATAARNWLAFWSYERVGLSVVPGTDEMALGLTADALARTYKSSVLTLSDTPGPVRLKHGIRLRPDIRGDASQVDRLETVQAPATAALDHALSSIERVHGAATADFVALQIEYPERRLR